MKKKTSDVEYGDKVWVTPDCQLESPTAILSFNPDRKNRDFIVLTNKENGNQVHIQYGPEGMWGWRIVDPLTWPLISVDFDVSKPSDKHSEFFLRLREEYPFVGPYMRSALLGLAAERQCGNETSPRKFLENGLERADLVLGKSINNIQLVFDKETLRVIREFEKKQKALAR